MRSSTLPTCSSKRSDRASWRAFGLDYATLAARNPRLVYCSLSGYGVGGPLEQAAGHDANYLAQAGILERNGNEAPVYFDPPVADTTGSLFAVIAILGALRGRDRTGRGCEIDIGLADVAVAAADIPGGGLRRAWLFAVAQRDLPQRGRRVLPHLRDA